MKQKHLQLTQRVQWNIKSGFSLVEVILAISIFGLFVTIFSGAWLYGQETTAAAGKRARAVFLAEEGLEAVRNIRDENFSNLVDGIYGLVFSGGQWNFSGSFDTSDIYTRQIIISSIDSDRKQVSTQVSWQQTPQRIGTAVLTTYLTNWRNTIMAGDCSAYCGSLGYALGVCRQNSQQCSQNDEIYEIGGDEFCIGGANADTCCCSGVSADITPPSAITDLVLSGATTNSIDLNWTAPGDDGIVGVAASYDIRYANALITEINWGSATQVAGEPSPNIAGIGEMTTIGGLNPNTNYYFAIKTSDEIPNTSTLSNTPALATLALPPVVFFQETFSNLDAAWNGSTDTNQTMSGWSVYQGNGDNDDIQISNEDIGSSPSGGAHLTFEDCDEGFQSPENYDIAYISVNLSGYSDIIIEYYWQSDDVDGGEGMRVAYSINSTNGRDGDWIQIASYLDSVDDVWHYATYNLPNQYAVSSFMLRFSSKSNATSEHMYVDDVKITGTPN